MPVLLEFESILAQITRARWLLDAVAVADPQKRQRDIHDASQIHILLLRALPEISLREEQRLRIEQELAELKSRLDALLARIV